MKLERLLWALFLLGRKRLLFTCLLASFMVDLSEEDKGGN